MPMGGITSTCEEKQMCVRMGDKGQRLRLQGICYSLILHGGKAGIREVKKACG